MGAMGMRTRDIYRYSKKDLNDLKLLKMECDMEIYRYLSEQECFSGKKIIYEPGSTILVGGKPKTIDSFFIDYALIIATIWGVQGNVCRVEPFRCPHKEIFCKPLIAMQGKGRPPVPQEMVEKIHFLRGQGLSIRGIAKELGIGKNVAQRCLKRSASMPVFLPVGDKKICSLERGEHCGRNN